MIINENNYYSQDSLKKSYNRTDIERIQLGVPTGIEKGYEVNTFQPNENKNLASYMKIFDWQDIFENSSGSNPTELSTTSGYQSADMPYWRQYEKNKNLIILASVIVVSLIIFKRRK